jgi:transcriptional repressor NF-X1
MVTVNILVLYNVTLVRAHPVQRLHLRSLVLVGKVSQLDVALSKERMHEAVASNVADRCHVVAMSVRRRAMRVHVRCFCGRLEEGLQCWQVEPPGKINVEAGVFSCEMQCPKMLPCGNHMCGNKCHPGACGDCELSPSVVRTCPCGKKNLAELQDAGSERQSCTDPIPTCQQMCGKFVTCKKHPCRSPCHSGPCPPCDVVVDQKCQCGASTRRAVCHFTRRAEPKDDASGTAAEGNDGGLFLCDRKCGKMRSCGRHRCNDR